ncbi:TPA: hypothetical protein RQK02_004669 [Vibrio vulnificus]|nr:hypothetical protein [Vibrio vulnificus]HDY7699797.1 hypothetical protein [Vibrio vulnificus]
MDALLKKLDRLDLSKSEFCMSGRLTRAFLERSPFITDELLPSIKNSCDSDTFRSKVMRLYLRKYELEKKTYANKFNNLGELDSSNGVTKLRVDYAEQKLRIKTFNDLLDSIKNEYSKLSEFYNEDYKIIHGKEDPEYIEDNYHLLVVGELVYDNFKNIEGRYAMFNMSYSSYVYDEYKNIGIDLNEIDNQFLKYKLLSLNDNIEIHNDKDSQTIRDKRIDKFFWINLSKKLLSSIEYLMDKNLLSDISFRIDYISEYTPDMLEKEYGSILGIDVSKLPEISKFYTVDNYDNNLWVRHNLEKQSLTFEEMMEDFEVVNQDVVTQIIHLEYFVLGGEYFIKHLDHEFIFYTLDEYDERLSNPDIKGHKKIKSFKVDNAKIPFRFKKDEEYFLYQVLDAYLENKELISEYLSKCNTQE